MASKMAIIWCMMVLMIVGATAETYNVGGGLNWSIPPFGGGAYRDWASRQTFEFGDILLFNWTGTHNVARVSREEYDACTFNNPIGPIQLSSPANFTIDNNATSYYLCTVDRHCDGGQKIAITVGPRDSNGATAALFSIVSTIALSMLSFM